MVLVIWLWCVGHHGRNRLPTVEHGNSEIRTLVVFGLTALAWITRTRPFGGGIQLELPQANDASVAFIAVIFLFCLLTEKENLLDWKTANRIPWGMLVLVGAGLCLGEGFKQSGLSTTIASVFQE